MGRILRGVMLAFGAGLLLATVALDQDAQAQNPADQLKERSAAISKKLGDASKLLKENKYEEATAALMEADKMLVDFSSVPNSKNAASTLDKTVVTLRKSLETKGAKVPERPKAEMAAPATKPGTPAPAPAAGAAGGISFTKDVAPILVGKCNRCHLGNNKKSDFSAQTYNALMQGAKGVKMVEPGNGKGSRLYEVVESGDMPRGGGKLTAMELASIEKWITAGAKYDGPNPAGPIGTGIPAPTKGGPPVALAKATGNEKVSFARDIAPVLAAQCSGCHGTRNNPGANLRVNTMANFLKGGDSGQIMTPGKGADSLIVKKIKGMAGARMPLRAPALTTEQIEKFETWVNEGGKFDGMEAEMDVGMVAAIYVANHMTYEELAAKRHETAIKNWDVGNPDEKVETVETPNFSITGNVIKSRLEEYGEVAEKQHAELLKFFEVPEDQKHLLKGKLTLFVFAKRYEYGEYAQMVENRKVPSDLRNHWFFNIIDAYACLPPPEEGDTLESQLSEVIAGAYIDSAGWDLPDWFSQGAARAIAARMDPKCAAVKKWDERIPGILAGGANPEGLLKEGGFAPGEVPVLGYGFTKMLLSKKPQFLAVLKNLKGGSTFDAAFKAAYNSDPGQLVVGWARGAATSRTKKGK